MHLQWRRGLNLEGLLRSLTRVVQPFCISDGNSIRHFSTCSYASAARGEPQVIGLLHHSKLYACGSYWVAISTLWYFTVCRCIFCKQGFALHATYLPFVVLVLCQSGKRCLQADPGTLKADLHSLPPSLQSLTYSVV